jgi:serine palmitoyltransferase
MARSLGRSLSGALMWTITHSILAAGAVLALSFLDPARQASPHLAALHSAALDGWHLVAPGGAWHPTAFIEHKGHLVVEGFLLLAISYLLLQGTFRPGQLEQEALTPKVQGRAHRHSARCLLSCIEWQCEPHDGLLLLLPS